MNTIKILITCSMLSGLTLSMTHAEEPNPIINSDAFLKLATEAMNVRESRLVGEDQFIEHAQASNTVILDVRSREKFDKLHIKGAVHLNFSDFNEKTLSQLIGNKDTTVLIYCNNNFKSSPEHTNNQPADLVSTQAITSSRPLNTINLGQLGEKEAVLPNPQFKGSLALNLPTYLTLYGYGYKNVYELQPLLDINKTKISLAGSQIDEKQASDIELTHEQFTDAMEGKTIIPAIRPDVGFSSPETNSNESTASPTDTGQTLK